MRYIFYFIFLSFIAMNINALYTKKININSKEKIAIDIKKDTRSIVYELKKDKDIYFLIPNRAFKIRILSNINIPKDKADRKIPFSYSIKYDLLDKDNNILFSNIYTHYTKVLELIKDDKKIYSKFYLNSDYVPSLSRQFFINFKKIKGAIKIRLSIEQLDKDSKDIVLRTYYLVKNIGLNTEDAWSRLDYKNKKNLAEGNIYGYQLLTKKEKKELLSTMWRPLGPLGIKDQDYYSKILYNRDNNDEFQELLSTNKQLLNPPKRFVYNLEKSKSYYLKTFLYDNEKTNITINYYDKNNTLFSRNYIQQEDEDIIQINNNDDEGTLEIFSDKSIWLNLFDKNDTKIDRKKILQKNFLLTKENPLRFRISHLDDLSTPLRLTYRSIKESQDVKIYIQIGDKKYTLDVNSTQSIYDTILDKKLQEEKIFHQSVKYFDIKSDIKDIILSSSSDMLINVAVIPPSIAKTIIYKDDDKQILSNWFTINPINNFKAIWVSKQKNSSTIKEKTIKLSHNELKTTSLQISKVLLIKRENNTPLQFYHYNMIYTPIQKNKKTAGFFKLAKGLTKISSHIIYKKLNNKKESIYIYINGKKVYQEEIYNKHGIIYIPILKDKKAKIEIKTEGDIKFWINKFIKTEDNELFIKRYVYDVDNSISFKVHKKSEESLVLSFKLYTNKNIKKLSIKATLNGIKRDDNSSKHFTLKNRKYEIENNLFKESYDFIYQDGKVAEMQTIFFTLGDDIKEGDYTITLSNEQNLPIYIYGYESLDIYKKNIYLYKELL